jgi:NAD dependent epimerase/dehydratase family enzyme
MGSQRVASTRLQAGGYRFGFDTLEAALRAVIRT